MIGKIKVMSFKTFKKYCDRKEERMPVEYIHCRILKYERRLKVPDCRCSMSHCPVWSRLQKPKAWGK